MTDPYSYRKRGAAASGWRANSVHPCICCGKKRLNRGRLLYSPSQACSLRISLNATSCSSTSDLSMAKNTSPLVVAVTGATTSAVNGSSISPIVSPYSTSCPGTRSARKIPPAGVSTVARLFSLMTVERYPLWQVYFTTPTRLRYRSTALTACVALSSSIFAASLV